MSKRNWAYALLLCGVIALAPRACAQEDGGEDEGNGVRKFTVRDYLEANLPPQEGRKIVLDEITGLLTITDTPKNQDLALELIREWDIGPQQISIEAKFIEITFTDLNEMGVDWDAFTDEHPEILGDTNLFGDGAATTAATFAQAGDTSGLGFLIGKATMSGSQFFTYLKALVQSGKVNLLNAPRITTLSGQMANLQVVRSFPYATSVERKQIEYTIYDAGNRITIYYPVETYEVEEEMVGILLEVTPSVIEGSDIITLDIHPEVTKLTQQVPISADPNTTNDDDLGWPIIDARVAQTSVMVRSGETIIIGGLIQDLDQNSIERKVPFLGDIPLVGNLFRYKYDNREKKNLVVFLTARLIDAQGMDVL